MRARRENPQTLSNDLFCMRGMGILLVVIVHVLGVDAIHGLRKLFPPERADLRVVVELIHSFNMAVMLMGSGVAVAAFGRAEVSLPDFLRKKVTKLLIPMMVWAPALFLMHELLKRAPQGLEGWLGLVRRMPATWFPAYSIFWFVHALVGCTLLAWLFRRFVAPALGRWSGLVYFALAVVLHLVVNAWKARASSGLSDYLEFLLSWNRFFGLGLLVAPWLPSVRQALTRLSVAYQALVPAGFLALIMLVYAVVPAEQYPVVCAINGPLGFCMLFSLATFLRSRSEEASGVVWKEAWRRLGFAGSISMTVYLFHLYFVAGTRIVLERLHPGTPVSVHLVLGIVAGCVGPWLLFRALRGYPLFHWTIGLTGYVPRTEAREEQPHAGLAPIALPKV